MLPFFWVCENLDWLNSSLWFEFFRSFCIASELCKGSSEVCAFHFGTPNVLTDEPPDVSRNAKFRALLAKWFWFKCAPDLNIFLKSISHQTFEGHELWHNGPKTRFTRMMYKQFFNWKLPFLSGIFVGTVEGKTGPRWWLTHNNFWSHESTNGRSSFTFMKTERASSSLNPICRDFFGL